MHRYSILHDILGEEADGSHHDKHLTQFLHITRQHNLKLNLGKFQFKTKEDSFFGTTFTSNRHKPADYKAQASKQMP